ncbi:MAG: protease modulator HflC [SAR324 cluster bacterium]|nr:protease modulator HflC [SAR324 cluster bacterium]
MLKQITFGIIGLVALFSLTTYVVDKTQYAIEIRLGDPVTVHLEPGLKFKIPFITKIFYVDNRLMTYDADPGGIFTQDKKEMLVDNYAKWRVTDPLKFYETVRSVEGAQARLDDIIYSQTREVLGRHTIVEIVSGSRNDIMTQITKLSQEAAQKFGIEITDVRIKRADLPEANSRAVFGRMEAERRRIAKTYRSEGEERALEIRSAADRDRVTILAAAKKTSEELHGAADAKALEIYAAAFQKDPEFYAFKRSHDVYRETLQNDTTLIMSADKQFFQYLR